MEAAANACIEAITARYPEPLVEGSLVLCGPGNNGGDGLAIARLLADRGHSVEVVLFRPDAGLKGDAATQFERIQQAGVSIRVVDLGGRAMSLDGSMTLDPPGLIVDALFGTGLCRDLEGIAAEIVGVLGRWHDTGVPVFSVDIP
jgi:NAD(P)H-hydrate epimerase